MSELSSDEQSSLRMLVSEAVQSLGYFEPDKAETLAAIYNELWPRGTSGTMLIYNDLEDLSPESKSELGLTQARFPKAVWDCLSQKGRTDPRHACQATSNRVFFNLYRVRDKKKERVIGRMAREAKFNGATAYTCAAGRKLEGKRVPISERTTFPLSECDAEWCACRWDPVIEKTAR